MNKFRSTGHISFQFLVIISLFERKAFFLFIRMIFRGLRISKRNKRRVCNAILSEKGKEDID